MKFAVEPFAECWDEMVKLAEAHWNETQAYRHSQPFAPSFERYNQYAQAGWFLPFTARDEARMVGYGGVYLVPSMHTQSIIATEDTWYLLPEYRRGWAAITFLRFIVDETRRRGAQDFTLTAPHDKPTGAIVKRLGFEPVATVYNKQFPPANG